jgi:hypothetical protein
VVVAPECAITSDPDSSAIMLDRRFLALLDALTLASMSAVNWYADVAAWPYRRAHDPKWALASPLVAALPTC